MDLRALFECLAFVVQAVSFAVVHKVTRFIEDVDLVLQPPEAIFGIHIHFGIIPIILRLLGTILFWVLNVLNPRKNEDIEK